METNRKPPFYWETAGLTTYLTLKVMMSCGKRPNTRVTQSSGPLQTPLDQQSLSLSLSLRHLVWGSTTTNENHTSTHTIKISVKMLTAEIRHG